MSGLLHLLKNKSNEECPPCSMEDRVDMEWTLPSGRVLPCVGSSFFLTPSRVI